MFGIHFAHYHINVTYLTYIYVNSTNVIFWCRIKSK